MLKRIFEKKGLLFLLICCILILAVSGILYAVTDKSDYKEMTGKITVKNDQIVLQTGKNKHILCLIPPAAMDSMDFHPANGDTLTVKGFSSKKALVVWEALHNGKQYAFRDSLGNPAWKGVGTWKSDTKKCIGCRLCFMNCPVNAISMQKINGMQKAVIDETKCTGCNTCITGNGEGFAGCPVKAITK